MDQWDEIAVDGRLRREMAQWISPCAVEGLRSVHGIALARSVVEELRWLARRERCEADEDIEAFLWRSLNGRLDLLEVVAGEVGVQKFWE